jgi:hypothetical protein
LRCQIRKHTTNREGPSHKPGSPQRHVKVGAAIIAYTQNDVLSQFGGSIRMNVRRPA